MIMSPLSSAPKSTILEKYSWPGEPRIKQFFSLPSTVVYYISRNPSNPTVYLKLAQSCKYFFEKLPLLIAKEFYGKTGFCPNQFRECMSKHLKCCVAIDLTKLSSKIWLTSKIYLDENVNSDNVSLFCSRIYRFDITRVIIYNTKIAFKDFQFIALSAITINLNDVKIVYDDGSDVALDAVLEAIPNIEEFYCYNSPSMIISTTLKSVAKLKNLSNLRFFKLKGIAENCNISDILTVIKKLKHTKIQLDFVDNISEGFKNQLNALIDTVIEDKTLKCLIRYDGQDDEKLKNMYNLFN